MEQKSGRNEENVKSALIDSTEHDSALFAK